MTQTTNPPTCRKCGAEMRELPRVIGAWPRCYVCTNEKCEQGGLLIVDVREVE